jgi:hypothetical protein
MNKYKIGYMSPSYSLITALPQILKNLNNTSERAEGNVQLVFLICSIIVESQTKRASLEKVEKSPGPLLPFAKTIVKKEFSLGKLKAYMIGFRIRSFALCSANL